MRRVDGEPHKWKIPRTSVQRVDRLNYVVELRGKGGSAVRDLSSSTDLTRSNRVTLVKFLDLFEP